MTPQQPSKQYDAKQELKYCSILLRRAAASVATMIREFLNSIMSIPQKNISPSVDSSQQVTAGPQKSSEQKFGSAKYYVRTATENTPLSSRTTTPIPKSSQPCEKSMQPEIMGPEHCAKIRKGIEDGEIDLRTISVATWLQVSYLALFNKEVTNGEQTIVYKGNVYNLHFCVSGITPPAQADKLGQKQ